MNSDSTKNGAYEYPREDDLIGRPYTKKDAEFARWLKAANESMDREEWWNEVGAVLLATLLLVFVGVVLWKVWR